MSRQQKFPAWIFFLALLPLTVPFFRAENQQSVPVQKPEKGESASFSLGGSAMADVLFYDRMGRFVDGLTRDQFVLLVDDKPQVLDFFETVSAGSSEEEAQWDRARGRPAPSTPAGAGGSGRGRSILFFIDDLHISEASIATVRNGLTRYIDTVMGPEDRVTIVAASNTIGFLRQSSSDKTELRALAGKLISRRTSIDDAGPPLMTEAQAIAIEQDNAAMLAQFVRLSIGKEHGVDKRARQRAERLVRVRASALSSRSAKTSEVMLSALIDSLSSYEASPGRKIAIFLSDGFFLRDRSSNSVGALMQATGIANRGRIAVYAINSQNLKDPGSPRAAGDTAGSVQKTSEAAPLPQDGLSVLSIDTGGRFLRNAGTLAEAVDKALQETSRYYLLGWRVDPTMLRLGNSKSLKVIVKNRPDLKVQLRQNSIDLAPFIWPEQEQVKDARGTSLLAAIRSSTPQTALPVSLYTGYFYRPDKGPILVISLQAATEVDPGEAALSSQPAATGVLGVILDKSGAVVDWFRTNLTPLEKPIPVRAAEIPFSRAVALEPGLYQVRVAAQASRTGGSASEWIEVPPLVPGKLALSSIFFADEKAKGGDPKDVISTPMLDLPLNVRRRYTASANLNYLLHIYNPVYPEDGSPPKLSIQTRILRGDSLIIQDVMHPIPTKVTAEKGSFRYVAQVMLTTLAPGAYTLEIIAADRTNGTTAQQRGFFWIK